MFERQGEHKGVRLELQADFDWKLFELQVDVRRLRTVLTTLVANSLKYTLAGSIRVTLGFDEVRSELVVRVADTGIGMNESKLRGLF